MTGRLRAATVVAVMAVAMGAGTPAPVQAQADCPQVIFMFSGVEGGPALNIGTFGCVMGNSPDVRVFTPGATVASAATTGTVEVDESGERFLLIEHIDIDEATGGHTVVSSSEMPLTFNPDNSRWSTESFAIEADAVRASAVFTISGNRHETTYRHAHTDLEGSR
ncbi:MAG TPA: hypothetical protein VGA13_12900 [Acidimicrobiales bacterium]|jgi:hypothetical protein